MADPSVREIDLHGFHPYDDELYSTIRDAVRSAYEAGASQLVIIHGHGHNRFKYSRSFVNSNTGFLGTTVRSILRQRRELRHWMLAKFDCSHDGSTTVRLRQPKPLTAPAFHYCRRPDGSTAVYTFHELLLSPDLQAQCVDKRRFNRAVDKWRKAGHLMEIPYIGPRSK